jgi:hypothetical protein
MHNNSPFGGWLIVHINKTDRTLVTSLLSSSHGKATKLCQSKSQALSLICMHVNLHYPEVMDETNLNNDIPPYKLI